MLLIKCFNKSFEPAFYFSCLFTQNTFGHNPKVPLFKSNYCSSVVETNEKNEEELLEVKRNKSKLQKKHYRILKKQPMDYTDSELMVMPLRKYRQQFGKYGFASKVEVRRLWPSLEELEDRKEWEQLAYPDDVHEMVAKAKRERHEEEEKIWQKQRDIQKNMKSLQKWKDEINARIAKQKAITQAEFKKKQEQIEDVRKIFGYRVSPHDPQFQEALQKREEDVRRAAKKAKKLKKQEEELQKLKLLAETGKAQGGEEGKK